MKRILSYVALIFLCACSEDFVLEYEPELVVEGWIESDGYPVVIVTSTVPIEDKYIPLDSLQNHLIRWAKVSVSDGEQEVVLTGRMNNDYFPPYIYTTSRFKGQAGKKYKLKVEYSGRVITAETTIPAPVPLEWIKVRSSEDGSRYLTAGLKDNPEEKNYYKFFTKVAGKDSSYVSSFMGLIDDEMLSDDVNEVIIRGEFEPDFGKAESSVYYSEGDLVLVRFCTLDKAAFDYWEDYEDIISLSLNPFFPVNKKMRSNISTGYGYWAGYGSTYYRVPVVDSLYLGNK